MTRSSKETLCHRCGKAVSEGGYGDFEGSKYVTFCSRECRHLYAQGE